MNKNTFFSFVHTGHAFEGEDTEYWLIEASNNWQANEIAERLGADFDADCPNCGPHWSRNYDKFGIQAEQIPFYCDSIDGEVKVFYLFGDIQTR